MLSRVLLLCIAMLILTTDQPAQGWPQRNNKRASWRVPRSVPLLTQWGRAVTPKNVHREYPRPQFARNEWLNLNGLGEFGGLGLAVPGHTWKKEHWGYQGMDSPEHLTSKYEAFLDTVYQLMEKPGLAAAVYTQITDVEIECNGLLTYDRAMVKPVLERVASANRGDISRQSKKRQR